MTKKDDTQKDDTQHFPSVRIVDPSQQPLLPNTWPTPPVTVTTGTSEQLPTIGFKAETPPEIVVQSFADKVKDLMNHAVQQSIPAPNQQATEYHGRFANWANALGDLWREVKQHAQ